MKHDVLIVDDHQMIRESISSLLRKYSDFRVIGQAAEGAQAIQEVAELKPDVVILDINLPQVSGPEAAREMLSLQPTLKILAVSIYSDRPLIDSMIQSGAAGFILKDFLFEELIAGMNAVTNGRRFYCSKLDNAAPNEYLKKVQ